MKGLHKKLMIGNLPNDKDKIKSIKHKNNETNKII